jgi:hypothetical protein
MASSPPDSASEMAILRRVIDLDRRPFSGNAARTILALCFDAADKKRMNTLAAKNQAGGLSNAEEAELNNYIRVGQTLGILQSKTRQSLNELSLE